MATLKQQKFLAKRWKRILDIRSGRLKKVSVKVKMGRGRGAMVRGGFVYARKAFTKSHTRRVYKRAY